MEQSSIFKIIFISILILLGVSFFGTSFLIRGCVYNPCRTELTSCQETCRQGLVLSSELYFSNQSQNIVIFNECRDDCQKSFDECINQTYKLSPIRKFEIKYICNHLSYK